jgi:hypothetical protein
VFAFNKNTLAMKKFFIIFAVVGLMLTLAEPTYAQTKAFKDVYKKIVTETNNDTDGYFKYVEVTYFEGNVLRSLTPKDRQDENNSLVKRIDSIYQIKLSNYKTNNASTYWYYEMRKVINGGCYTLICRSKVGDEIYEIFSESYGNAHLGYVIIISNNEKAVVCNIVGKIYLEDVLHLTGLKVSAEKEPIVIDSLDIEN